MARFFGAAVRNDPKKPRGGDALASKMIAIGLLVLLCEILTANAARDVRPPPESSQNRRLLAVELVGSPKTKRSHRLSASLRPFSPIPIRVDKDYNGSISGGEIVLYRVDYLKSANETKALRIKLSSEKSKKAAPLLVVVRTKQSILSWQLPLVFQGQTPFVYQTAARTICPFQKLFLQYPVDGGAAGVPSSDDEGDDSSAFIPLFSKIWKIISSAPDADDGNATSTTSVAPATVVPPHRESVYVDISSASNSSVDFVLSPTFVKDFALKIDRRYNVTASPSEPAYHQFTFPTGVEQVRVLVTGVVGNSTCAIISIQETQCPVHDLVTDVENAGTYQTMTRQATLTVDRNRFRSRSFYIFVVVKPQDYECNGFFEEIQPISHHKDRKKTVTISVVPTLPKGRVLLAFFGGIVVFLSLYFFTGLFTLFHWKFSKPDFSFEEDPDLQTPILPPSSPPSPDAASASLPQVIPSSQKQPNNYQQQQSSFRKRATPVYGTIPASVAKSAGSASLTDLEADRHTEDGAVGGVSHSDFNDTLTTMDVDSSDSDDDHLSYDMLDDVLSDKNIVRTKTYLFVSDLSRKNSRVISRKYYLYFLNLVTISVFYALPVMQLVLTYQTTIQVTGNEDICYYNWRCAYRFGSVNDFNNVASNMGYVFLGCLFLALVARRELLHHRVVKVNPVVEMQYGLPQHFGLLYALGFGLVMEGIMSACYHICPNKTNFQFDTSYMYMLACLQMLKIYQSRHPDINAGSHAALFTFAVMILLALFGVLYGSTPFYVIYGVLHVAATLALSAQIYYMGRWKLDWGIFKRIWYVIWTDVIRCHRPAYPDRLFLIMVGNAVNWSLVGYGWTLNDFATYLIAVFICNLLLYFAFYIIMKLRSGERIQLLPLCSIVLMSLSWGVAIYFFLQVKSDWDVSPAESREKNSECILLDFYDHHDVWHFVSAFALFFSFCILLTLDDDLTQVPRDKISVF